MLTSKDGKTTVDILAKAKVFLEDLVGRGAEWGFPVDANAGEMVAFCSYAHSFPSEFLALVDTYEVMKSGMANFAAIALVLNELGYKASDLTRI